MADDNPATITFDYKPDFDVLWATIRGAYRPRYGTDALAACFAELKKHNCTRVLADFRNGSFVADTMEAYERPRSAQKLSIPTSTKFALVFAEISEDEKFVETAYRNQGYAWQNFTNLDAALDWLRA